MKTRRQRIEDAASDLASSFLFYDRKEDDLLPKGAIEEAINAGEISVEEILEIIENNIRQSL